MTRPRPGRWFGAGALALLVLSLLPSAAGAGTFSNASLSGRYVFSFSGYQFGGPFAAAGILIADGRGNITAGILDQNSSSGVLSAVDLTGFYSIQPDGRGQGKLQSGWGTAEIRFQLISADRAKLIEFDSLSVGGGEIERQTVTSFSGLTLSGNYAFLFDGGRYNGWVVTAGRFTADGRGAIYQGIADSNDTGDIITDMALSGSYGLDSTGRGTARLDTWLSSSFFAFYPISASRVRFISLDYYAGSLSGEAERQDNTAFLTSSLAGNYVFLMRGTGWNGWDAGAGRLTADGAGTFTAGVFDENSAGTLAGNVRVNGAYTITQAGRGQALLSSQLGSTRIRFYMVSAAKAKFLTIEPTQAAGGVIERQQGAPFRDGSLAGSYGFLSDGFVGRNVTALVGSLNADGEGRVTGTQEVNDGGFLDSAQPVSGTYLVGEDGRGTLTSSDSSGTANIVLYAASPSRFFLVQMDSFAVLSGTAERLSISPPIVPADGLVNGASFAANMPVTAGAIVSLFGSALAAGMEAAGGSPLPTTLGEVTVTVNGVAVPLFFVSPGQINFQLPWNVAGQPQISLSVTSQGNTSAARNFALGAYSPGVFQLTPAGQGAVINALTGELAAVAGVMPGMAAAPVKRGDYVSIFCTGLGSVSPVPPAGTVSPADLLAVTLSLPKVTIGGREAPVSFSGLAPGFVGLYQVNAQVPVDASSGNAIPMVVSTGGLSSPAVTIAVQ